MTILISFGTRPEFIKIKPLINEFKKNHIPIKTLFTGQHKDIIGGSADISLKIKQGKNRLDNIVKSVLDNNRIFHGITSVMVQGDTTSAFAIALAAFHRKIPVIHLEAGLRTYNIDNPYPEELNRVAIDRMSSILLCPTTLNKDNLYKEGITKNVYITGNTGLDNLKGIKTSYSNTVLCTLHRRENHNLLKEWFSVLNALSIKYPELSFIIPLHPNPSVQRHKKWLGKRISIFPPMTHRDTINILKYCRFVITDSGGIQEESSFLKKRAFICRWATERTECIGKSSILCKTPSDLFKNFIKYSNDYRVITSSPYGNGNSSKKIISILKKYI